MCVCVCDVETSTMRRPRPSGALGSQQKVIPNKPKLKHLTHEIYSHNA